MRHQSGVKEEQLERAKRMIEDTQVKRKRLALTLADGKLSADIYRAADDQLVAELDHAVAQAKEIQERLADLPSPGRRRAEIEELSANPDWLLDGPDDEVRVSLLRPGTRVLIEESQIKKIVVEPTWTPVVQIP